MEATNTISHLTSDFYNKLYKSLDESSDEDDPDNKNVCLITNLPLEKDFITLDKCNHRFNYMSLYNDYKKQARKNVDSIYSKKIMLQCPYCRTPHSKVLPIKEGVPLVYGVNTSNNSDYIPIGYILGKCQQVGCVVAHVVKLVNGKCYCNYHKYYGYQMLYAEEKQKKQKEKQEALEKKQKEKEEAIALKEQAKQAKLVKCIQILKSGPNKGNPCGCKVFQNTTTCLRHSATVIV